MLQRESSFAKEALRYGLIVLVLGSFVFPIAWMIITSFQAADRSWCRAALLFTPTLENYTHAIYDKNFLFYIKNTLFILRRFDDHSSSSRGRLAAYSFARYNVGDGPSALFILSKRCFGDCSDPALLPDLFGMSARPAIGRFRHRPRPAGGLIISYTVSTCFRHWLLVSFSRTFPRARTFRPSRRPVALKVPGQVGVPAGRPRIAVTGVFTLSLQLERVPLRLHPDPQGPSTVTVGGRVLLHPARHSLGPGRGRATISLPMLVFVLAWQR